jgi:hypothetical protein
VQKVLAFLKSAWERIADFFGFGDEHPTITLENRIDGSAYMLSYMARKGIDFPDDKMQAMIDAQYALDHQQPLTLEQEHAFWRAYLEATRLIAPVSIDSIKTSGNYTRLRSGRIVRGRAGFFYRVLTIAVLASLLITQVYWLIGHKLVSEISRLETTLNVAVLRYALDGRIDRDKYKDLLVAVQAKSSSGATAPRFCIGDASAVDADNMIVRRHVIMEILKAPPAPPVSQTAPAPAAASNADATATAAAKASYDLEAQCIMAHLVHLWRAYDQLYHWSHARWLSIFWPTTSRQRNAPDKDWVLPMLLAEGDGYKVSDANSVEATNDNLLATSRLKLEILSTYLLPLLYGLLGACAYVLRSVTAEVKAELFSRTSDVSYRLRLMLGLVAGLSIGWFLHPTEKDAGLLASLSPLALAFVAGYSVELLFAALDRIVNAFSSKSEIEQVPK